MGRTRSGRCAVASTALCVGLLAATTASAEETTTDAPVASEVTEEADKPEPAAPVLNVGVGLRSGLLFDPGKDDAAATLRADDQLNVRPYISGTLNEYVSFEGNLDVNDEGLTVLDAVAKFSIDPLFNVWAGRFLPPSSRANLSGPYYQNAWNYPLEVHGFPNNYAGRDDGVAVWGQVGEGKFKYQAGVFDLEPGVELSDSRSAMRVVYNVFDPEPGYYNSSTFYGEKDILAFGATMQYASTDEMGDFLGLEADVLFERNLGTAGVVTLEAAYFNFENVDAAPGSSFYVLGSYLLPKKVAIGKLQPMTRYEHMNRACASDADGCSLDTVDVGVNYVIDGHKNRLALVYRHMTGDDDGDDTTVEDSDTVQLGVQIQM